MIRRVIYTLLGILGMCTFLYAQQSALEIEIDRAQLAFDSKKYTTAANLFKRIYPKVKEEDRQNKMLFMIAESYRCANNFKLAYDWYEKLVNTKYPDTKILYSYGLLLKNFEKYEDATRQFNDYLFEVPNDPNAKRELQSCGVAQGWKNNPEKFDVRNVLTLNTAFSDYAPFYVTNKLIWASSRPEATGTEIFEWTGQKCSDFFESTEQNNHTWSKPKNVKGGVNTNYNDGAAWIDVTATTMYLTQCNGSDGKGSNCKIYESHFTNSTWTTPTVLPFSSDSFSVGHPFMTANGKRMYFSSNMPGGFGEKDIYYIDHNPNTEAWGKPVNLGANINTNEDDMYPAIDNTGALYYASKGKGGMGGLDLYKSVETNGTFAPSVNLKSPINSGGDDFGIAFVPGVGKATDRPIAYYTSNREGGLGDDDIYSLSIKPYLFLVKGKVTDKSTGQPLGGAKIDLTDETGAKLVTFTTGTKGEYGGEIPLGKSISMLASKSKYFSSAIIQFSSIGLEKDSTIEQNFVLDPIPTEEVEFVLQGIYYDLDKFDLRPRSKEILDSLVIILKNNPEITIELASHTDSRAPADYNIKLSQKRANTCVNYLVEHGISRPRLTAVGYGETRLVNDCTDGVDCTEEEHQQNRRTTFKVLKMDYKGK